MNRWSDYNGATAFYPAAVSTVMIRIVYIVHLNAYSRHNLF